MRAEINTLTSTRVPRNLTELITLGRTLKRRAGDILAYIKPPPHHRRPHPSHQRPPRTPTRIRTRTCETSPTTSPEHSSKQEDSNLNYTPNYEEPAYLCRLVDAVNKGVVDEVVVGRECMEAIPRLVHTW